MFTTCPACRMNLAVTATDLRLGQGYVRCGRCERVFNALMSLSDDLDPEQQSGHAAHGTTSLPAIQIEEPDAAQESQGAGQEPVQDDADPAGKELQDDDTDEESGDEQDSNVDVTDSAAAGTVETIVLEGDTYLQTEEHLDEDEVRERLRDFTVEHEQLPETPPEPAPAEIDADAAVGNPPRAHWAWRVAAVVLLLALAAQLVHHYRQALVANQWLEKPLQSTYALFGIQLEPAWDLGAYDLRQLGGEELAASSSTIVLRAAVQNRAPHPQPPPLIRVRLEDRFGNVLSISTLEPVDYLNGQPIARMAADQRLDVELRLQDPNRQAVSFDLDACLPGVDGAPHCAHDP